MRSVDPSEVDALVAVLIDERLSEAPRRFLTKAGTGARPGLYTWWADDEARTLLGAQLGIAMPALIYAGEAGATRWPSGRRSTATLRSRIRGNHIGGNASSSTFRLTLSSLLLDPLDLEVARPGCLTPEANRVVSDWIKDHLRVAVAAFDDRDTLGEVEEAVLDVLDPPLNLRGRPAASWRADISRLRQRIVRPD